MNLTILVGVVVGTIVSLVAPLGLRSFLNRYGVFDVPNERSSHVDTTLRGGGLAPLMGVIAGGSIAIFSLVGDQQAYLAVIAGASILVSLVGLTEDLRGLRISTRIGLQLVVGALFGTALHLVTESHPAVIVVVAFAFAAYVNFANFMDGVNAMSSLHGIVAGIAYALLGALSSSPSLVAAGSLTAATFLAFLPWNITPPGLFLGDVGSYLLGGLIISNALIASLSGIGAVAAFAPLSIYLADTISTLLRRIVRGEAWHRPHRGHVYQRVLASGLSHIQSAALTAVFTAACTFVALVAKTLNIGLWAMPAIALLSLAYLGMPALLDSRSAVRTSA